MRQVIDPVAYQTFKDSLLPPKYRPTVRVRVAVGVYSFAQEFLGFPPEEGVSSFAASDSIRPSVSNVAAIGVGKAAESVETYAPFAKIPGLGTRMTILQLQNGDVGSAWGREEGQTKMVHLSLNLSRIFMTTQLSF